MESHSKSCCSIPPVASSDYQPKGKYEVISGTKTYVTGSPSATAILFVYDIFGYYPQTIQGADILAYSDPNHQYQVFIPDFFDGEPAPLAWFPPDTEEKGKLLGAWFEKHGFSLNVPKLPLLIEGFEKTYPNIKSWNIVGTCWGGKIASLTSGPDTPWKAAAHVHPAMVDPADALKISIPTLVIASQDENPEEIKAFEKSLQGPKAIETFDDQIHGFMAARADLEDAKVREEYARGYKTVLHFFAEYDGVSKA